MGEQEKLFESVIQRVRRRESFAPIYKIIRLDLSVARNELQLDLTGFLFQVIEATDTLATVDIRVNESIGDKITMRKGFKVITPFYRLFLTNTAQVGKFITLAISPSFDLFRVEFDTEAGIEVGVDWLNEIRQGRAFGGRVNVNGVVAQNSFIQLFNPDASGVILLVKSVAPFVVTASEIDATIDPIARGALQFAGVNLKTGVRNSKAELRSANNQAAAGEAIYQVNREANLREANLPPLIDWIAVLEPGNGIDIATSFVNTRLVTNFSWAEIAAG